MSIEGVGTECLLMEMRSLAEGIVDPIYQQGLKEFIRRFEISKNAIDSGAIVPIVHAHWEDGYSVDFKGGIVYTSIDCSHCNEIFKTDDREYWKSRFKVCPFCGAKMDGGNEDE